MNRTGWLLSVIAARHSCLQTLLLADRLLPVDEDFDDRLAWLAADMRKLGVDVLWALEDEAGYERTARARETIEDLAANWSPLPAEFVWLDRD